MTGRVDYYAVGTADVSIYFPQGDVACHWCHLFLRYEEAYRRYSCRLTGEWILEPWNEIGQKCPLKIKKEEASCQSLQVQNQEEASHRCPRGSM